MASPNDAAEPPPGRVAPPERLFLPGHVLNIGAEVLEGAAQFLDHVVGAAEVEVLVPVLDVSLEEGGVDAVVQQRRLLGRSVTVQSVSRPRIFSNSSRRTMSASVRLEAMSVWPSSLRLWCKSRRIAMKGGDPGPAGDEGAGALVGDGAPDIAEDQRAARRGS